MTLSILALAIITLKLTMFLLLATTSSVLMAEGRSLLK